MLSVNLLIGLAGVAGGFWLLGYVFGHVRRGARARVVTVERVPDELRRHVPGITPEQVAQAKWN